MKYIYYSSFTLLVYFELKTFLVGEYAGLVHLFTHNTKIKNEGCKTKINLL